MSRIYRSRLGVLSCIVVLLAVFTHSGWATSISDVSIDTTGVAVLNTLAFKLIDGDCVITRTITIYVTDGTLVAATNTNVGAASGNLPGNLPISGSDSFNSSQRSIFPFGTSIAFRATLTENFAEDLAL